MAERQVVSTEVLSVTTTTNPDGTTTETTTTRVTYSDGRTATRKEHVTRGMPNGGASISNAQDALAAVIGNGTLIRQEVHMQENGDGSTTLTTTFHVQDGKLTRQVQHTLTSSVPVAVPTPAPRTAERIEKKKAVIPSLKLASLRVGDESEAQALAPPIRVREKPETVPQSAPLDSKEWEHGVQELLATEKTFLARLQCIDKFFLVPIRDGQMGDWLKVESLALRLIFGTTLPQLTECVHVAVIDLEAAAAEGVPTVDDVIEIYTDFLHTALPAWRDQVVSRTLGAVPLSGWRQTVPMLNEFLNAKTELAEKFLNRAGLRGGVTGGFEGLMRCMVARAPLILLMLQRLRKAWPDASGWDEVIRLAEVLNRTIDENAEKCTEPTRTRK